MLADARSVPADTALETDICIIGAGAAGIALALRLKDSAVRVVLLESGGEELEAETQALYQGPVTGLPYFPLDAARLRFYGGSTNHWGGVCRPFDEVDFEPRDWIPGSGWPIRRADVAPYYERAQEICRVATGDWDLETWVERDRFTPFPFDEERIATRVAQIVAKTRRSFADAHGAEIEEMANVTVLPGRERHRARGRRCRHEHRTGCRLDAGRPSLQRDGEDLRARGGRNREPAAAARIEHAPPRGHRQPERSRRTLLPRASALRRGRASALRRPGRRAPSSTTTTMSIGKRIECYLALTRELQRKEELGEVQIRVEPVYAGSFERALESDEADSFRELTSAIADRDIGDVGENLRTVASDMMTWQNFVVAGAPVPVPYPEVVGEVLDASAGELQARLPDFLGDTAAVAYRAMAPAALVESVRLVSRIEPIPNPDSRVKLTSERDALGMPQAELDWRLTRFDRRSARRTLEILAAEVGRAGIGRVKVIVQDDDSPWPDDLAGAGTSSGRPG